MRSVPRLAIVASFAVSTVALVPSVRAIEDHSVRIAVASAARATCADVAPAVLSRLTLGHVLVQQADLEGYDPAAREVVLSRPATLRLVTNAAAIEADLDDPDPLGPLPDANGRAFVLMLGGERELGGLIVSRLEDLREIGECPVLVMGPVLDGRLHLIVGRPRSRAELHEDLWKVFLEEGPGAALAPALPEKVSARLAALFPLK
jgi:hypothetical protein